MDIDHFRSATTQEQLDMMMMLQMDKLPDFFGTNNNNDGTTSGEFLSMGLNGNGNINIGSSMPQLYDNSNPNPNASSPAFLNHLSALSFSNSANHSTDSSTTGPSFLNSSSSQKRNSMAAMREMIFRIAAMQPIHIDPESVKPPKRRNVKISKDPQSVAARHRRERISERIRILQRLVPGGTKMDTASMLDEAIHYVKFLKTQVQSLERVQANNTTTRPNGIGFPVTMSNGSYLPNMSTKPYQTSQSYEDA